VQDLNREQEDEWNKIKGEREKLQIEKNKWQQEK